MVAIFDLAGQVGVHVVGVHPGAGYGVGGGMADGEAVLDDVFAFLDGGDGHLVALGDILHSGDGGVVHGHGRSLGDGMQRDHHIVAGIDFDSKRHERISFCIV